MKVIFRSNDSLSRKYLGRKGGAEEELGSLDKYLSEDAVAELSLMNTKKNKAYAILDVKDNGLHVHAVSNETDAMSAIDDVILKISSQLVKYKEKMKVHSSSKDEIYFFNIEDDYESQLAHECEVLKTEKHLAEKKNTKLYKHVVDRYINYLYSIQNFENAIERAENHLAILYNIFETEKDTMLYRDVVLLVQDIEALENEINNLINIKNNYKLNVRDEAYINESIDEELNLLSLKR